MWPHCVEALSGQHAGKALRISRRMPGIGIVEVDVHVASLCLIRNPASFCRSYLARV